MHESGILHPSKPLGHCPLHQRQQLISSDGMRSDRLEFMMGRVDQRRLPHGTVLRDVIVSLCKIIVLQQGMRMFCIFFDTCLCAASISQQSICHVSCLCPGGRPIFET
jgi:hypothetical protein